MKVGTQLAAPTGLGSLRPGETYHFVLSDSTAGKVTLLWFAGKDFSRVCFIKLQQEIFESALMEGSLVLLERQSSQPPWLADLEDIDPQQLESGRRGRKTTYLTIVERRYLHIETLAKDPKAILGSADPAEVIARHAKACTPKQNPTRLAVWFGAYIVSGKNIWSLMPRFLNIGGWDRSQHPHCDKKLGRPSLLSGKRAGHSAIPIAGVIADAYVRFAKRGAHMTEIYNDAIRDVFKCKVTTDRLGHKTIYHPQSLPFPTLGQFRYWVMKQFGMQQVHLALYGAARVRSQSATSEGRFASSVSNILERSEVDAYQLAERPKCMLSEEAAPVLVVARSICVTTGAGAGIGFSLGGESAEAYSSMLFCMAVPKSFFCAMFGLEINDSDWPCEGLSPHYIVDRGPGAKDALIAELERKFPIRELAPSYAGQSKACVESSHPRKVRQEGKPTYVVSRLNVVELMKREILRTIKDNETSDVASRLTPQMITDGVAPNPHALWRYLDARGRNDAMPMSIAEAVRTFLKPVQLKAQHDGLYLSGLRFDSKELRESKLLESIAAQQVTSVPGYVYPLCARLAWIECKGKLLLVEAMLPLRDDEGQTYLSLGELAQTAKKARELNGLQREHSTAAKLESDLRFDESTGKSPDAGKRSEGRRPKASALSAQESFAMTGKGRHPSK
jgi:hypothetical protein